MSVYIIKAIPSRQLRTRFANIITTSPSKLIRQIAS
jgi:hypothetical protein